MRHPVFDAFKRRAFRRDIRVAFYYYRARVRMWLQDRMAP